MARFVTPGTVGTGNDGPMRVAVIPARGGSKRIPRKNVRLFAGEPMIAHSIRAAAASDCFDRIVVSTDDDEIAEIAAGFGAEIPFRRPAELSDDHTGTVDVVRHAVSALEAAGPLLSHVCCVYATAPFLSPQTLREGLETLKSSASSYVFGVAEFTSPIQRALRIRDDRRVEPLWPENVDVRSQDLEPTFHDAGQFYWGTAEAWREAQPLHASSASALVLPSHRVQDIDTPEDWARAEYLYAALQAEQGQA